MTRRRRSPPAPDPEVITLPLALLREVAEAIGRHRTGGYWKWQPTTNTNQPPTAPPEGSTDHAEA